MDTTLFWILGSGLAMSAIALVGGLTVLLPETVLRKILLPLVALAAGSLLGGALFHLIPEAVGRLGNELPVYVWIAAGFLLFFVLEQFLHWHHCHRTTHDHKQPLGYLLLLADGLHNFIGGLAVGAAFIVDIRVGITTWVAAAAHEIPQELGDFGALVHGGWSKRSALALNLASALTFPLGSLIAYFVSGRIDVTLLLCLGAGNFLYIAAADLVPEVKRHADWKVNLVHFLALSAGLALLLAVKLMFGG